MFRSGEPHPEGPQADLGRSSSPRSLLRLVRWVEEHAAIADVIVAVGLFVAVTIILATAEPGKPFGTRNPDAFAYFLGAALTLPLAVRRRWPLPVFGVTIVGLVAFDLREYAGVNVDFFGPVIALYTVAAHLARRVSLSAALFAIVTVLAAEPPEEDPAGTTIAVVLVIGGVWLLGDAARSRRIYAERLHAQAEALRAARLELADQAVGQERLRIARELHDVVAHHMSAIVVQSALAQERIDPDPSAAHRAMAQVEEIGRGALREMRQILGVLRQAGEDQGALAPAPSLADLGRLYDQARAGGLTVDVDVAFDATAEGGPGSTLPPAVQLAAYRIVQESLTNALRHAPGTHVEVRIDRDPHALGVEVIDHGTVGTRPTRLPRAGGQGLVGMRERVALLNGSFAAGPRPGGGFRVAATLPLEDGA